MIDMFVNDKLEAVAGVKHRWSPTPRIIRRCG